MKLNYRSKTVVLLSIAVVSGLLFAAGIFAAYQSRHDTICPDGKVPLAQRGGVIGQTEYLCRNGKTVTK